jgi:hypothetical protein
MDPTREAVSECPPHLRPSEEAPTTKLDNDQASTVSSATPVSLPMNPPLSSSLLGWFTFFRKLPHELRRMIWPHALSRPRVITIQKYGGFIRPKLADSIGLMSVCRESRLICMEHYKLVELPRTLSQPRIFPSVPPIPFYFSATNDICHLDMLVLHHFSETTDQEQLAFRDSMRAVVLDPQQWYPRPIHQSCMRNLARRIVCAIAKYTNLERLVFLREPGYENMMETLVQELASESDGARQGLDRIPLVLENLAGVTFLSFAYESSRRALCAREKVILAYAA